MLSNGREGRGEPLCCRLQHALATSAPPVYAEKNMRASMTSLFSFFAEVIYCITVLYIVLLSHPLPHHAAANRGMPLESQAPERV